MTDESLKELMDLERAIQVANFPQAVQKAQTMKKLKQTDQRRAERYARGETHREHKEWFKNNQRRRKP